MVVLPDRTERNQLRQVMMKAQEREVMTREEAGFVIALVERFRADIEKKIKQLNVLQGEIGQLQTNERIVVELIESMVAAAERDIARQETMNRLREAREKSSEEEKEQKAKAPEESEDH